MQDKNSPSSNSKGRADNIRQSKDFDTATVNWVDDRYLVSEEFDDVYFSTDCGLEETQYVFIEANRLPSRFKQCSNSFTILETGFGTGLNFLATWDLWNQTCLERQDSFAKQSAADWLNFVSIEKFPLASNDIQKALSHWPGLAHLKAQLIANYPQRVKGFHRINFPEDRITLTLIFDDIDIGLAQLQSKVDAWFLDGFTPSKNPQMWSEVLFQSMARLSDLDRTTFATFTSASFVRKALQGAGFSVAKQPGFGKKREMMFGDYQGTLGPTPSQAHFNKPWFNWPPSPQSSIKSGNSKTLNQEVVFKEAIVVGAGIAGASTAYALAKRGWKVTVLEQNQIASAASGNHQGVLYAKLSADQSHHSDFYLNGYLFSLNMLKNEFNHSKHLAWQSCGVLQLAMTEKEQNRQQKFFDQSVLPNSLVQWVNPQQASDIAKTHIPFSAVYFPEGGWVNPPSLCRAMLDHENIKVLEQTKVDDLKFEKSSKSWSIVTTNSGLEKNVQTFSTQNLILCQAHQINQWTETQFPTKSIRGQVSLIDLKKVDLKKVDLEKVELEKLESSGDVSKSINQLETVVCGKGYVSPVWQNKLSFGATFDLGDSSTDSNPHGHKKNLSTLTEQTPNVGEAAQSVFDTYDEATFGRVGFRCATPDYTPIAGPVADFELLSSQYAWLRKKADRFFNEPAPYLPGLFVNIGHGSRGLISAPLCGELLASNLNGDPSPLPVELTNRLHPSRFFIRDMIRNKV